MIPLRDNIPPRTFPFVNYLVIALCAVVFLGQLADQSDGEDGLVERLGMIPARVFHPNHPITIREEVLARGRTGDLQHVVRERTLPPVTFLVFVDCVMGPAGVPFVVRFQFVAQ